MKEILGCNLNKFFNTMDPDFNKAEIKYAGAKYEVWEVTDELHKEMCEMPNETFDEYAGEDAWWNSAERCILGAPKATAIINGKELICWNETNEPGEVKEYDNLSDYFTYGLEIGMPRNICACSMDLAKYNNLTLAKLFRIYEC